MIDALIENDTKKLAGRRLFDSLRGFGYWVTGRAASQWGKMESVPQKKGQADSSRPSRPSPNPKSTRWRLDTISRNFGRLGCLGLMGGILLHMVICLFRISSRAGRIRPRIVWIPKVIVKIRITTRSRRGIANVKKCKNSQFPIIPCGEDLSVAIDTPRSSNSTFVTNSQPRRLGVRKWGGNFPAANASRLKLRSATRLSSHSKVVSALFNPCSRRAQAIHLPFSATSRLRTLCVNTVK